MAVMSGRKQEERLDWDEVLCVFVCLYKGRKVTDKMRQLDKWYGNLEIIFRDF